MSCSPTTSTFNGVSSNQTSSTTQNESADLQRITELALPIIRAITEQQITYLSEASVGSAYAYFDGNEDYRLNMFTGVCSMRFMDTIRNAFLEPHEFIQNGAQIHLHQVGDDDEVASLALGMKQIGNDFVFALATQKEGDEKIYSYEGPLKDFEVSAINKKTLPFKC